MRSIAACTATLITGEKVALRRDRTAREQLADVGRPSVSPLAFMRALKKAGLKKFDAYAHHPYYGRNDRDADHEAVDANAR